MQQTEPSSGADGSNEQQQRPPYSFVAMNAMAILSSPDRRLLAAEIRHFIETRFPYLVQQRDRSYKSIGVALSTNERFVKVPVVDQSASRGAYWTLHPDAIHVSEDGSVSLRPWMTSKLKQADRDLLETTVAALSIINRLKQNATSDLAPGDSKKSTDSTQPIKDDLSENLSDSDAYDPLAWISLDFGQDPDYVDEEELKNLFNPTA